VISLIDVQLVSQFEFCVYLRIPFYITNNPSAIIIMVIDNKTRVPNIFGEPLDLVTAGFGKILIL
jgi:hypothetical protein